MFYDSELMKVQVVFHGELSELTGAGHKYYYDVSSLGDLKLRIRDDFPGLVHLGCRVFLNDRRSSENAPLKNNDKIILIPERDL